MPCQSALIAPCHLALLIERKETEPTVIEERADLARRAIRIGAPATLSRNFQMEFLRPILGRADVDMILRWGSTSELLGALEALNLDIVLLNQAPMADSVTPFIAQHVYQQRVIVIGRPSSYGQTRREARRPAQRAPRHPADARQRRALAIQRPRR
ncbi:hypothetical protein ASC96_31305 [Rhizobium sp. Root1204]|nr:hypothetical protein ASC96_31305 [Rhizobium sp. Root1204]